MRRLVFALAALLVAALPAWAQSRVKDIAQLQSTRDNQLVGYGLVVGLQGSGDSLRNAPFTEQSMRSMLDNLGKGASGAAVQSLNLMAGLPETAGLRL